MRVFGHHVFFPILVLLVVEFGGSAVAFGLSVLLIEPTGVGAIEGSVVLWGFSFSTAVLIGITAVGLYHPKQRLKIEGVLARICVGLGFAAIFLALFNFFFPVGAHGLLWTWSFAISLGLLITTRALFARFVDHEGFRRQVLVYGAGERAARLFRLRRRSDRRGFNIVAFLPAPGDRSKIDDPRVVSDNGRRLLERARERGVDEIVVAMDDRRSGFPVDELLECKFAGIAVVDLVSFLERETGRVAIDLVNPSWLIFSDGFHTSIRTWFSTRVLDLVVATVMFAVFSPVMLVAALAILIEDGRPVLYRQRRVGYMGRTFEVLKFRSMIKDAEADGRARWAGSHDDRITRVGAVLRKLRIDELPQLINVLVGDMSLVGPRPERPEFVERLAQTIPYYHERHVVKPGITGWAQLSYPYGSSEQDAMEKLQYDLYYIKHKTVIFDLVVLLQTAEVVLWGKGAR